MRIQITLVVDTAPPPWCQLSTLPLASLPLFDQAGQSLKLNIAGCQIANPFHFEIHLIFVPRDSPQHGFFCLIGH